MEGKPSTLVLIDVLGKDPRAINELNPESSLPEPIWQCPKCLKTYKGRSEGMIELIENCTYGDYNPDNTYPMSSRGPTAEANLQDMMDDHNSRIIDVEVKLNTAINHPAPTQVEVNLLKEQVVGLRNLVEEIMTNPMDYRKNKVLNFKLKY